MCLCLSYFLFFCKGLKIIEETPPDSDNMQNKEHLFCSNDQHAVVNHF